MKPPSRQQLQPPFWKPPCSWWLSNNAPISTKTNNSASRMKRDRTRREFKPTDPALEESYASFCNRPSDKGSPMESSSFLHEQWPPLTTDELKKCLPEQYSQTFDGKPQTMLSASALPPMQQSTFRLMLDRLKSQNTSDRAEALRELSRLTSQGCLTIQQAVVIDFGGLFRDSDVQCFDSALACYQSLMKQCIVKPQFIPIAIERAFRTTQSKNIGNFMAYLFTHHAKLYEQLAVEALVSPNDTLQQAFMWSLGQLVGIFGVRNLNYLTTYMTNLKNILSKPEPTRLKDMTVKLLQQCMKAEGPDCILSQLKDLPQQTVNILQNQQNHSFTSSAKDKSVARQSIADPLRKYNEEWVDSLGKVGKQGDKVKLLQQLLETLQECRGGLAGEYRHLTNMLGHMLSSNNMSIYIVAIRIIGQLARCLGKNCQAVVLELFPSLLMKFRDKKPQVASQISSCLNEFSNYIGLEQLLPLISDGLEDKNAAMKIQTIAFLERCLSNALRSCPKQQLNQKYSLLQGYVPDMFKGLLANSSSEVRGAAVECLKKMCGYMPSDRFPILLQAERTPSPDIHASRRTPTPNKNQSHSSQKEKQRGENSSTMLKLIARINDETLSLQKKKDVIQELDKYFQEGDPSTLARLGCLQDVSSCLRKCLMQSPKLLFRSLVVCVGTVYGKVGYQMKGYSKSLVHALLQSLKSDSSRKELLDSLQIVSRCVGLDQFMSGIVSALESDRSERAGILQFGIKNWQLFGVNECAMLSKGLLNCLNDKWQEVRQLAVEFSHKISQHLDMGKMRHIASRIHNARIPKELEVVLSQLQHKISQERLSVPVNSPVNPKRELFPTQDTEETPQAEIKDSCLSSLQLSPNLIDDSSRKTLQLPHDLLRDDLDFSPILSDEEWLGHQITFEQERSLKSQFSRVFKQPICERLFSLEPSSAVEIAKNLRELCNVVNHIGYLHRLYVLLLKWILLRLWGGCRYASPLFELAEQIVAIMAREKNDSFGRCFPLTLAIVRQYLMQLEGAQPNIEQPVVRLVGSCVQLLSGQEVLVTIIGEYQKDLRRIHPWVSDSKARLQKNHWRNLMKAALSEYMDDRLVLAHLSQVQELRQDQEICRHLYSKCVEEEIVSYGFKKPAVEPAEAPLIKDTDQQVVDDDRHSAQPGHLDEESQLIVEQELANQPKIQIIGQSFIKQPIICSIRGQDKFSQEQPTKKQFATLVSMTFNPDRLQLPCMKGGSHYRRVTEELQMSLNTFHSGCNSTLIDQLDRLTEGDLNNLAYFEQLLKKPTLRVSAQLKQNSDYLLASFVKLCLYLMEIREEISPQSLLQCYGLLHQTAKCQYVMLNAKKAMPYFIQFTLHQTVHEEEQRVRMHLILKDKHPELMDDCFVHAVNPIMMRILDNCPTEWLLKGLVQVAVKTIKLDGSLKLRENVRRCLSRATQRYTREATEQSYYFLAAVADDFCRQVETLISPEDPLLKLLVGGLKQLELQLGDRLKRASPPVGKFQSNKFLKEFGRYAQGSRHLLAEQAVKCSNCSSQPHLPSHPLLLSADAISKLQEFQKSYPGFDPSKYIPSGIESAEPEVQLQSDSSESDSGIAQQRNMFEDIRQEIQDASFSNVSAQLAEVVKTSELKENARVIRARLHHLQSRIQRQAS